MNWKRTCRMFRRAFRARRERVREQFGPPHSWWERKRKIQQELVAAGGDIIFEPFLRDEQILLRVRGKLALIDLKAGEAYLFPEPRLSCDLPEIKPLSELELAFYPVYFSPSPRKWMGVA